MENTSIGSAEFAFRRFVPEFASRDTENTFLDRRHSELLKILAPGLAVAALLAPAFIVSDYKVASSTGTLALLVALRALTLAALLLALYGIFRNWERQRVTSAVVTAVSLLAALTFYVSTTRPTDYFGHVATDVVIISGIYILTPVRISVRVLITGVLTALSIALHFLVKESAGTLYYYTVPLALLGANVVGFAAAASLERERRKRYQRQLEVETALAQVKTLSGLIPICAYCRKVRDDEGYWKEVEGYIEERSAARFTYGLCPNCDTSGSEAAIEQLNGDTIRPLRASADSGPQSEGFDPARYRLRPAVGGFFDSEIEAQFGQYAAEFDRRRLIYALAITIFVAIAFGLNDFLFASKAGERASAMVPRTVIVAAAVAGLLLTGRVTKHRDIVALFVATAIGLGIAHLAIDIGRPAFYYGHVGVDLLAILLLFMLTPTRFLLQTFLASAFAGTLLFIHYAVKDSDGSLYRTVVPVAMAECFFLGLVFANALGRVRRANFTQIARLEHAKAHVHALSGLLPVCSGCRKVRDDEGYWSKLESYVTRHSSAMFSHGICPECRETVFREIQ